jgi:hypothetical protein
MLVNDFRSENDPLIPLRDDESIEELGEHWISKSAYDAMSLKREEDVQYWCCWKKTKSKWEIRFPIFIDLITDHTRSRLLLVLIITFLCLSFILSFVLLDSFQLVGIYAILKKFFVLDKDTLKPWRNETLQFNLAQSFLNVNFGILTVFLMAIISIPILTGISVWQSTKYRILSFFALLWFLCMHYLINFRSIDSVLYLNIIISSLIKDALNDNISFLS